jgi:hypothetical protein
MSLPILLPYDAPRNLDRDAWFLYQTTSIPYYELCARLCEEFAHFFNKLITGHEAHGMGRVDYWVSRYLSHAEDIRRGIGFVKHGDHMPMLGLLNSPSTDFRGLIENAFGYEARDEWREPFQRMSYACGTGADVLRNNERKGLNWLNRSSFGKQDLAMLDDSRSIVGDTSLAVEHLVKYRLATPPTTFPVHPINRGMKNVPGGRCPQTGVWVPCQWSDDGSGDYNLAFCIEGRPMPPAYKIAGREVEDIWEDYDCKLGIEHKPEDLSQLSGTLKTVAEDTTWYFVGPAQDAAASTPVETTSDRLRCEANNPCPREGYWFTPAKARSRRRFQQGETMPAFSTDYGATIWQWDQHQDG